MGKLLSFPGREALAVQGIAVPQQEPAQTVTPSPDPAAGRLTVHGQHLDRARRRDEVERVGDRVARQVDLLVALLVHEDDVVARVVEVLHLLDLGVDARELLARSERPVDDRARVERLHLRPYERATLAGLHVLELDDAPRRAVELDVHPVPKLVRGDDVRHRGQVSRR